MLQLENAPTGLARYLPILGWLPRYQPTWLRFDLVAGLTAAAVVIPQAMAYAAIAGLPVQVGLYTALVPMLIYFMLGTSRPLSVSSTSTISMLTATELARVAQGGDRAETLVAASTLAFLVGVFLLLAGLLRMGFLANFISLPVLTGFKAGIGLVILVGQLGKVLGIPVEKGPVFQTIVQIFQNLDQIHWLTLALALVTLAILIFLPRLTKRLPAPLIAVAVGILASALLNLEASGVKLVGEIPAGLPTLSLPNLSLVSALWPGALGIALMSFVESIASARAFAKQDDPPVDADQELRALGAANIGGGFFQAYPAGGGTSQTAVNDQAGARSQLAEAVTAGVVVVTLLFLAPLIGLMPEATLGALVLVAAAGLIKVGEFRAIGRIRRHELAWAILTFVGVVILGTLEGIMVAVVVSMLDIIVQANHPPLYVMGRKPGTDVFRPLRDHPDDETFPGLLILRTEGRIYFANAPRVREQALALIQREKPSVIVVDCSAIPDIEYTALKQLTNLEERLREAGIVLWLAALNPEPLRTIQESSLGEALGRDRMFFNLQRAVEAFVAGI
ncbi:MAG TPA: SulP family inorganic anion transporter [Anaerolineae bacterium]|nr:SulP family inorganic anion transporter [Anaerolineae bacterium]